ncbi:hypothetical protein F4677DRAFT_409684, partial [Hypoxylon crocopeplum]
MDTLPTEILHLILEYTVVGLSGNKNRLLVLRTTCKLFDEILKPFALRTLQLEYTRLDKTERKLKPPDEDALHRIGDLCRALYIDMMVVRDESEVRFLGNLFTRVPSLNDFFSSLRDSYSMNEESFTEIDYRRQLGLMFDNAPNVTAVKLSLPFQLICPGQWRSATMILGNSFEAMVQRPEGSKVLKTLVLENLCDVSVRNLWRNPQDVKNIIGAFSNLQTLFISVRRNEPGGINTDNFCNRLWEMIGKAENLESLCLVDLDADAGLQTMKTASRLRWSVEEWQSRCLPTPRKAPGSVLPNLTFLELRQVQVMGCGLLHMLKCFANSLQELYLDGVHLKVLDWSSPPEDVNNTLWIGLPNARPRPELKDRWVAVYLRQIQAKLRVCRVSNLGYERYVLGWEVHGDNSLTAYDLLDPCGLSRSLEQRFVEVATGIVQPPAHTGVAVTYLPEDESQDSFALADRARPEGGLATEDWHATYYMATQRNPTSACQRSIDGQFPNYNQFTLNALHTFADKAYNGMCVFNRMERED